MRLAAKGIPLATLKEAKGDGVGRKTRQDLQDGQDLKNGGGRGRSSLDIAATKNRQERVGIGSEREAGEARIKAASCLGLGLNGIRESLGGWRKRHSILSDYSETISRTKL